MTRQALSEYRLGALRDELSALEEPPSRADKILQAFYRRGGTLDLDALPISKSLRKRLETMPPRPARLLQRIESQDGTRKLLLAVSQGAIESVLMPGYKPEIAAACVSSQLGCAMGCDFCASTTQGFLRNLTAAEIVEQFLYLRAEALSLGRHLKTLVFMGMGEPMHNLDAVLEAIDRIASPSLGALGWKNISVSTVGIVPGIERLSTLQPAVNLALSLHAPDDETRRRIVPMNKRYPVQDIIEATKAYAAKTKTIPNIEYCLLADVNDSLDHAHQLAQLLQGMRTHVNVIPYNPIGAGLSGKYYQKPSYETVARFVEALRHAKIVAHIRDTRGDDVAAACGQLAAERMRQT